MRFALSGIAAAAIALLTFGQPVMAAPIATTRETLTAEYLYGVPAGLDMSALVDKPRLLGTTHQLFQDETTGERRLTGYAEAVAVYDMPLESLVAVACDFASYPSFVPRILEATVQGRDGPVWRVRYNVGIRFLGVEVAYRSIFDSTIEHLDDGAVGVRAWQVQSLDGGLYESYNSFYFAPVTVNGKTMCFVRYFNRPGIRRPGFGLLQVLDLFTPPESRAQVAAIANEARRRAPR
ncbi:MAG TPA: hypothetical protein VMX33_10380 [bacterium]|nr:hypothetical protein [bacterium]